MIYDKSAAEKIIIESGHKLLAEGLVSRTWGNISARIGETRFLITPSGRDYESLRAEDLVEVDIATLAYEGQIKPSSEKGIHASIYAAKEQIGFVIHTHQFYASAVSAAPGADVPMAEYGLPGTGRLRKNFEKTLSAYPKAREFLLARHGAVVIGGDAEEAFARAADLESRCKTIYDSMAGSPDAAQERRPWLDDYAQLVWGREEKETDDPEAAKLITSKNRAAAAFAAGRAKALSFPDAMLQRLVYTLKYSRLKDAGK